MRGPGGQGSVGQDLARAEHQRRAVLAMAQSGGLRAIVEDMAEMPAAAAAMHFGAGIAQLVVGGFADGVFERLVEAGPAGARVILGRRIKQRQVAALAGKDASAL